MLIQHLQNCELIVMRVNPVISLTPNAGRSLKRLRLAGVCRTALVLALGSPVFGSTVVVTGSISQAISEAGPGDTVLLQGPTVFPEHVVVSKPIHLLGTNSPVIDGDGAGTVLTVNAAKAEVAGLVIRNSGRDLAAFDSGILIQAPKVAVHDCRLELDGFGVYIRGKDECVVERNEMFGNPMVPSAMRGNGIHLWKTHRNRILNNSIRDKRDGMYFSYTDDNVISGNRVRDTRFGIHYMYSHDNRLLNNVLTANAVGATLMFSRQLMVVGNQLVGNRRHGMVLKQVDNSRIIGNVISGQNRGLFVQQANQNRFEANLIATNDIGLYIGNGSEENVFVANAFVRNTEQVWQPPSETEQGRKGPNAFTEKGRGNFWSDYTGSDRNQDGVGDSPYHQTDVFGYLVDRHPVARIFAMSPAVGLLCKGEELLPLLDIAGVTDTAPLMQPVAVKFVPSGL